MSDIEPEVDDEGRIKPRKGGKKAAANRWNRITPKKGKTHSCHICFHQEWNWKLAFCTTCNAAYCYGVLWRAFELMPQTVMENEDWQCPKCLKICSCSRCRKGNVQRPYQLKGTYLGHDTRKVADYRSVESLFDFSKTNLSWLKDSNASDPQDAWRMKKLKEKAEAEKARVDPVDDRYLGAEDDRFAALFVATNAPLDDHVREMEYIEPSLRGSPPDEAAANVKGKYQAPFGPLIFRPTASGHDNCSYSGNWGDDIQKDWMGMDGHSNFEFYNPAVSMFNRALNGNWVDDIQIDRTGTIFHGDSDDYDATNAPSASYPSRLRTPVAPTIALMLTPAPIPKPRTMNPPEKEHSGYREPSHVGQNQMMDIEYYQQGNKIDRTVYNLPSIDDSVEEPSQLTLPQVCNLVFSDLIEPASLQLEVKKQKRPRHDNEGQNENFFLSKGPRKDAMTRQHPTEVDEVVHNPRPEKRLYRGSAGQPPYSHKPRIAKKGRPRGKASERDSNTTKTLRRSARLARKEADKSGGVERQKPKLSEDNDRLQFEELEK